MSELNEIMPRDIYLNKTIEIPYMKEKILRLKTMNEMIHKRDTNVCKKKKRKLFRKLIQKIMIDEPFSQCINGFFSHFSKFIHRTL